MPERARFLQARCILVLSPYGFTSQMLDLWSGLSERRAPSGPRAMVHACMTSVQS